MLPMRAAGFGLKADVPTILLVGGSLGARTMNESVLRNLDMIGAAQVQFIWQTGGYYKEAIANELKSRKVPANLYITDFIARMDLAYRLADLVISRAGASSISELCLLGKPSILVPSPNVAEDHQTHNAMALVNRQAALIVKDAVAVSELIPLALRTVVDSDELGKLGENAGKMAYKDAIARYFLHKGLVVGGYDRTPSDLTRKLQEEGASVHYTEDVEQIPTACRKADSTLVIYTPAIPAEHKELAYFRQMGFEIQKRAQVLGTLTRSLKGLCVAGTHGKTTTSSMAAHLLHQSHIDCNAFLGGITKNYGTNYILSKDSPYVVIEADEFDRSFHWLTPFASVITATDADHLDIYGTEEAYLESFSKYSSLIQPGGYLILHTGLKMKPNTQEGVTTYTYSREEGDFHAENVSIGNGEISFDLVSPLGNIKNIKLGVPVSVNIENGIAAMALAQIAGADEEEIRKGMESFGGVDRRFDFRLKTDRMVYLSDYAHHPEEIRQSLLSIRQLYEGKRIKVIFQPHLYTRTRDFYREFADALSLLDDVTIVDIYPAREAPIPGVTSALIYDNLRSGIRKQMCTKDEICDVVRQGGFDVLITLGAGDIENYADQITGILKPLS